MKKFSKIRTERTIRKLMLRKHDTEKKLFTLYNELNLNIEWKPENLDTYEKIIICKYSKVPFSINREQAWDISATEFRDNILIPTFQNVIGRNKILILDLDGGYGYSPSWITWVFGPKFINSVTDPINIFTRLKIVSHEEPALREFILSYIISNIRKCD